MRINIPRPGLPKPFRTLAKLANDSDRAKLNGAFALFSLRRRIIAAMLAVLGVFLLIGISHGTGGASVKTLVATEEIASGTVIIAKDVALREVPIHLVADGSFHALEDAVGQIAVGGIRRGEMITDARVVAPSLLTDSGRVAIAITLSDPANAQLVHAGDHVDVLASQDGTFAGTAATGARVVATAVEVLSTSSHDSRGAVVLAVSAKDAQAIAGINDRITLVLLG